MSLSAGAARQMPAGPHVPQVLALTGNPNSGKTTLFNALTGLRQRVGNYPGITVEKRAGTMQVDWGPVSVLDLPGTYSLVATSPDERIVSDVLRGSVGDPRPDAILAVVDASNLARNLYLVSQLLDLRLPLVVALNMTDLAAARGRSVDPAALARAIGCEVVPVVGHKRGGIEALRQALARARLPSAPVYELPGPMALEQRRLGAIVARARDQAEPDLVTALRLLVGDEGSDLASLRRDSQIGVELARSRELLSAEGLDPISCDIEARYHWIDRVVADAVPTERASARPSWTDRIDAVLMHPALGLAAFVVFMALLFVGVFFFAKPITQAIESGANLLSDSLSARMPPGPVRDLLIDGVVGGVSAVLVFVPQVALLFFALAVLEDSGYLARAAFLMDRLLSRVGLHGKSFIPLLSSFGCAIPGILSTRTIESRRERLATILVAPFMGCSARLPVYALLIAACFPGLTALRQGGMLLGLYLAGIAAAIGSALLLRKVLGSGESGSFILELPTYKIPQASQALLQTYTHTRAFVARAGTTILAMSVVLWALLYYPRLPSAQTEGMPEEAVRAAQVEYSLAGRLGHGLEPALRPLGFDWKMGVGLIGAFAAREVFVSTLGVVYRVTRADAASPALTSAMTQDRYADGRPVWSPLVTLSLMVWFVLALQCMSTVAVVQRETGGWTWPLAQVAFMNTLAYLVCLLVFQVGTRLSPH